MLMVMQPHLLCASCGGEMRAEDGTSIPSIDMIIIGNMHMCSRSNHQWLLAIAEAMPTRYSITRHGTRLMRIDTVVLHVAPAVDGR